MSITPLRFTGISAFSDDFQAIVDRTVAIASLPVKAMESYQQEILADKTGLGTLSMAVTSLSGSLSALKGMKDGGSLSVSASSTKVTASMGSGAAPGVYILSDVTSLAQTAVYTAAAGMADTDTTLIDQDGTLNLVIDGVDNQIVLGSGENNLAGLRDAINGAGLGVSASIVDTGSGSNRYYLTLTAEEPGARTYELRTEPLVAGSNIIAQTRAGSDAHFSLNGKPVTAKDNYITGVVPGLNFLLNQTTGAGEQIELTVKSNRSPVTAALSKFVAGYNDLAAVLAQHRGEAGGSLAGSGIVLDLVGKMMNLTGVTGSGSIGSLADLGVSMGADGVMSLDSSVVSGMSSDSFNQALEFMASENDGLGGMASRFQEFSDPVDGYILVESRQLDAANQRYARQIETVNERISSMQASLLAKLQAADALLASMESQKSMMEATMESLSLVTNGRRDG